MKDISFAQPARIGLTILSASIVLGALLPCVAGIVFFMVVASTMGSEAVEALSIMGLVAPLVGPILAGVTASIVIARGVGTPSPAAPSHTKAPPRTLVLVGFTTWLLSILVWALWFVVTTQA